MEKSSGPTNRRPHLSQLMFCLVERICHLPPGKPYSKTKKSLPFTPEGIAEPSSQRRPGQHCQVAHGSGGPVLSVLREKSPMDAVSASHQWQKHSASSSSLETCLQKGIDPIDQALKTWRQMQKADHRQRMSQSASHRTLTLSTDTAPHARGFVVPLMPPAPF